MSHLVPGRPMSHLIPGRSMEHVAPDGHRLQHALPTVLLILLALAVLAIAILTAVGAFTPSTAGANAITGGHPPARLVLVR